MPRVLTIISSGTAVGSVTGSCEPRIPGGRHGRYLSVIPEPHRCGPRQWEHGIMNERFDELLPWYANGSLGAEDRAWVETYLEQHPEARSELDWYRSLQRRVQENAPTVPATIGLARTMRLIQGDRPTFAERLGAFFGNFGMRPSYAMAGLAIVAAQGGVILTMMGEAREHADEIRAM